MNMLQKPAVSQKAYVESHGYFVSGTGKVSDTQTQHIMGLLATYANGQPVAVLQAGQWASTLKKRDRRQQYIPGSRKTDQCVTNRGQTVVITRSQTIEDKIVPYLTERHRMPGVAPVPRKVTRSVQMVVPGALVGRLKQSAKAKKANLEYLGRKAARLLDASDVASLNSQTWLALMNQSGHPTEPSMFSRLMKSMNARRVGNVMSLACWTLRRVKDCDIAHTPLAHNLDVPMVLAGGMKASKRMLDWCARKFKTRSRYGNVPATVYPMGNREGAGIVQAPATHRLVMDVTMGGTGIIGYHFVVEPVE